MTSASETRASVCPLDCPDTCSLSVTVDHGRIVKVRGSRANPYTAGAVCEKVARYYPDFVHGERRLTRPLLRNGPRGSGRYDPVSWDQALDTIHQRVAAEIARHGSQTVLPLNYAGPHGRLAGGSMDRRFFNRLGATRVDGGPLCGAVRGSAYRSLFGNIPGMAPELAEQARLVAVWGNNVTVSNLHFARVMQRARRRGAKVLVVDPRRIRVAEQADLHVQPKPGTDVVLALALAAELERRGGVDRDFVTRHVTGYESYMQAARRYSISDAASICGIDADVISAMADLYASTRQIALSIGNGIERSRNGGSSLRAIMACPYCGEASATRAPASSPSTAPPFPLPATSSSFPNSRLPEPARSTSWIPVDCCMTTPWIRRSARFSSTTTTRYAPIPIRTECAARYRARHCSWWASTSS
jgi:anaerobic selenocysteine-containing dehydrogenase